VLRLSWWISMLEVFFRSSVGARERIHRMWPLELVSELETLS
jgi:hypothetical protein